MRIKQSMVETQIYRCRLVNIKTKTHENKHYIGIGLPALDNLLVFFLYDL